MTDAFGATTTTLAKMIPVAATAGILHGITRKRRKATTRRKATARQRVTTRRKPSRHVIKVRPKITTPRRRRR